jgi:hypothetical protein
MNEVSSQQKNSSPGGEMTSNQKLMGRARNTLKGKWSSGFFPMPAHLWLCSMRLWRDRLKQTETEIGGHLVKCPLKPDG